MDNQLIAKAEIHVKGMICSSCLKLLNRELSAKGAEVLDIQLGKIIVRFDSRKVNLDLINEIVVNNEFEIISDPKKILVERTKRWIINFVWDDDKDGKLTSFLVQKLNRPYYILSRHFSRNLGYSIKQYEQKLKVERAKEKIEFEDLSFSEIAYDLGYYHLSALSRLFKNHTGMSLLEYKNKKTRNRIPIDKL